MISSVKIFIFLSLLANSKVPRSVQLVETFEKYQQPVISLIPVAPERAKNYGVADIKKPADEHAMELAGLIEKPGPDETPTHDGKVYASTAGYIFTPEMLQYVEALEPDKSGELVLANAINRFAKSHTVMGRVIEGRWHDAGNKEKYLEAIVDVALADPSIAPAFRRYIEEKLAAEKLEV